MAPASLVDRSKRSVFFIIEWVKKVGEEWEQRSEANEILIPCWIFDGEILRG
jgi:hypothetical protein